MAGNGPLTYDNPICTPVAQDVASTGGHMALREPMNAQATHQLTCLPIVGRTEGWTPL